MTVAFDTELKAYEIPAFRGAVCEKIGYENDVYHNHNNQGGDKLKYYYRYPKVQYKRYRDRPMLVFVNEGIEAAQHFFGQPSWELTFGGKEHTMKIGNLRVKEFPLQVKEHFMEYRIFRWQALNQRNYEEWQKLDGLLEEVAFLEKKLCGHIISFASGVDWQMETRFEVKILEVIRQHVVKFKGVRVTTFDIRFKTNVFIPEFIGLGKGISHGYGVVRPVWKKLNLKTDQK